MNWSKERDKVWLKETLVYTIEEGSRMGRERERERGNTRPPYVE